MATPCARSSIDRTRFMRSGAEEERLADAFAIHRRLQA